MGDRVRLEEEVWAMEIRDKVVMVTGASSGIGQALVGALALKGSKVVMLARRTDRLDSLEARLKALRHEVLAVPTDITDQDQVSHAVQATLKAFGHIDVVIHNAGIGYFGTIERLPIDEFHRLIDTNVYGMLRLTQCAIPFLKETHGTIVHVSSTLSKRALPFLSAYASTKSMMNALADGLRLELHGSGVHVLTYCAPETETEFHAATRHEAGLDFNQSRPRKKALAHDVAARIVQAIIDEKREVVEGKALAIMNLVAPKLLDKILYKHMVQQIMKD